MQNRLRWIAVGCFAVVGIVAAGCRSSPGLWLLRGEPISLSGQVERAPAERPGSPVIVFLESTGDPVSGFEASPSDPVDVEIHRGELVPPIAVVAPGRRISFRNRDASHHEFFSVEGKNAFRVRVRAGASSPSVALHAPGLLRVFCELHPTENHSILVSAARIHAAADASGRFQLNGIWPGIYRLGAVGPHSQSEVRELHIEKDTDIGRRLEMLPR